MALNAIRFILIILTIAVSALYVIPIISQAQQEGTDQNITLILCLFGFFMVASLAIIMIDIRIKNKKLSALSGVFLGLIAGLIVAYALSLVVDLSVFFIGDEPQFNPPAREVRMTNSDYMRIYEVALTEHEELTKTLPEGKPQPAFDPPSRMRDNPEYFTAVESYEMAIAQRRSLLSLLQGVKVLIGLITCYLGISLVVQTKGDFRFVIPYVEFAKEVRGSRPTLLDTSVIIDGRILDIIDTGAMQTALIVPRFVLNELQLISDSADKLKRARGRRGLDMLQKLQDNHIVEVRIDESEVEGNGVDQKLVALAQQQQARIMTNDFNLNKIAKLRGVDVINLNDLAKALRPVVLPGEVMQIKIIKPGEGQTQGVGYLPDGTMVVVEHARHLIGEEVPAQITSTLQTSAGRMIFARNPEAGDTGEHAAQSSGTHRAMDSQAGAPAPDANPKSNDAESNAPGDKPKKSPSRHPGRNPRRSK